MLFAFFYFSLQLSAFFNAHCPKSRQRALKVDTQGFCEPLCSPTGPLIFASLGGNSLNEASEKIPRSIFHRSDWGKKLGHHPRIHSLPNVQTH
jgi:hypothetical protein